MTDSQVSISSLSETATALVIRDIPEIVITDVLGQSHQIHLKSLTRECLKEEDYKLDDLSLQIISPNFKSSKSKVIIGNGENKLILAENEKIQFVLLFETKLSEVFYNQICMILSQVPKEYCREIYYILFNEWRSHQTEIQKHSSNVDVLKYYIFFFLYRFQKMDESINRIYIKFFMRTPENKDNILFISRFSEIYSNENKFMIKILYEAMTAMTEKGVSLLLDFTDEKFTDKEGKQISQKKHLKNLLESFDIRYRDKEGKKKVSVFSTINEAQLTPIFKVLKSILKVVDGFSGSMYETPIPSCAYDYDCEKFNISSVTTLFDMMSQVFFRSIGIILTSQNFLFLISSLSMSILNETDEKYISVKPVFENFIKDKTFFEEVCYYNISNFNTFYQWKLLKFFEKIDGKRFNVIIENQDISLYNSTNFNNIECSVFLYLLTEWWKSSSLKEFDLKEIATIFGLKDYIPFIEGHKPIKDKLIKINEKGDKKMKYIIVKEPKNRSCNDWLINIIRIQEEINIIRVNGLPKVFLPCSSLEIINDITSLLLISCSITPEKMEEELDNFKEFLDKKSFNIYSCQCCSTEFTSIGKKYWHTFPCAQCTVPPKICMDCYNKTTISRAGHQLNPQTAGISCMNCNFVFPENISRFPEQTTSEQIRENSAEYFSCCFIGCNHFVHIPAVEGAICGVETGIITDTFCETHAFLLTIKDNAKNCPSCGIIITKTDGCNHITCRCGTEFCFQSGCPYFINGSSGSYTHHPYCRFGIKNVLTVAVFNYILKKLETIQVSQELLEDSSILINNNISIITQCLYYISSNGFEDPFITTIYQLQQFLSSHYYYHLIRDLITVIKGQLDSLFGRFTNQEMLSALQESVQENNSTLFDEHISHLLTLINPPESVNNFDDWGITLETLDVWDRTSSVERLVEIPSSDEEDDVPPHQVRLIHHNISSDSSDDEEEPLAPEHLNIPIENNDWIQIGNIPIPLDSSSTNEDNDDNNDDDDDNDDDDEEILFDYVDENDDEILERAVQFYRDSHY